MSKSNQEYQEIVDNEIKLVPQSHPFYNKKNKDEFISLFLNDMKISENEIKKVDKCNGLFSTVINEKITYFYVEYIDGGGRNKSNSLNPSVKICIPFGNKVFQDIAINDNILFLVNLYIPYKETENSLELDFDHLTYLFLLPNEIFEAEGYREIISNSLNHSKLQVNPSSRWASLDLIKNSIKSNEVKLNNRKNVFIIPKKLIKNFIDLKIKNEYQTWKLEKLLFFLIEDKDDSRKNGYIASARREFKIKLINSINPSKCQNINHNIFHETALRGSHIFAVNQIEKTQKFSIKEKTLYISDINNGLLLCANCDSLFDKYKFTIINNGIVLIKNNIKEVEKIIGCKNGDQIISNSDYSSREKYLKLHEKKFRDSN